MTVRELINRLIDLPKDSEVGVAIYSEDHIYVADKKTIKVEVEETIVDQVVDSMVWINTEISS